MLVPLPLGWHKVNFDIAIRHSNAFYASVCRDHIGCVTHAWIDKSPPTDPLWAEVKAALHAIKSTLSIGLNHIIFEGDALNIMSPIENSAIAPHWSIAFIISDINLAFLDLNFYVFSHVIRESNYMAHALAYWTPFCKSVEALSPLSLPMSLRRRR